MSAGGKVRQRDVASFQQPGLAGGLLGRLGWQILRSSQGLAGQLETGALGLPSHWQSPLLAVEQWGRLWVSSIKPLIPLDHSAALWPNPVPEAPRVSILMRQ